MYSTSMKPKVDTLFEELIKKSHAIVNVSWFRTCCP